MVNFSCLELWLFIIISIIICELILLSNSGDSLRELSESGLNSFSDKSEEVKFFLSGFSRRVIFFFDGLTERRGIIKESLVSADFSGSGVNDSGLSNDTLVKFFKFLLKTSFLVRKVFNQNSESGFIFVVGGDGGLFSGSFFFILSLDLNSEILEHSLDFFEKCGISLEVLGG